MPGCATAPFDLFHGVSFGPPSVDKFITTAEYTNKICFVKGRRGSQAPDQISGGGAVVRTLASSST